MGDADLSSTTDMGWVLQPKESRHAPEAIAKSLLVIEMKGFLFILRGERIFQDWLWLKKSDAYVILPCARPHMDLWSPACSHSVQSSVWLHLRPVCLYTGTGVGGNN